MPKTGWRLPLDHDLGILDRGMPAAGHVLERLDGHERLAWETPVRLQAGRHVIAGRDHEAVPVLVDRAAESASDLLGTEPLHDAERHAIIHHPNDVQSGLHVVRALDAFFSSAPKNLNLSHRLSPFVYVRNLPVI